MNVLLSGVGGQGTVLASRLIAQAAIDKGTPAKTAETIGMALIVITILSAPESSLLKNGFIFALLNNITPDHIHYYMCCQA